MAIKAVAEIVNVSKNASGFNFNLTVSVDDVRVNFDKGPFAPNTGWATIQPQLIQAVKDFINADADGIFQTTIGAGDTIVLLYPNFVNG